MTPMSARLDDLRQRLAALRTRFAEVAARAAAAAAAMRASAVPAAALLDDLRDTAADFDELRLAILDEASTLPSVPDPARLGTLEAPAALLTTIDGAKADRARRGAGARSSAPPRGPRGPRRGQSPSCPRPAPHRSGPRRRPGTLPSPGSLRSAVACAPSPARRRVAAAAPPPARRSSPATVWRRRAR